jgi:hypothetical protein
MSSRRNSPGGAGGGGAGSAGVDVDEGFRSDLYLRVHAAARTQAAVPGEVGRGRRPVSQTDLEAATGLDADGDGDGDGDDGVAHDPHWAGSPNVLPGASEGGSGRGRRRMRTRRSRGAIVRLDQSGESERGVREEDEDEDEDDEDEDARSTTSKGSGGGGGGGTGYVRRYSRGSGGR